MFGFDPVIFGSLLVLAAGPAVVCEAPGPPRVHVRPKIHKIVYDYTQDLADIKEVRGDSVDPHDYYEMPMTYGYTRSEIGIAQRVGVMRQSHTRQGRVCVWYDTINVDLDINSTIIIAKEVKQDRCMHQAVLAHEMKHVEVDRQALERHTRRIQDIVQSVLKAKGIVTGPVPASQAEAVEAEMQQAVLQVVQAQSDKMSAERRAAQARIDTREEYDRVRAECPDFKVGAPVAAEGSKSRPARRIWND